MSNKPTLVHIDGDVWTDGNGYQRHGNDKYVHRTIAERVLGRPLQGTELVHHIDGNSSNNKPNNLVICPNQSYHMLLHARQRIQNLGGHPDKHSWCSYHMCLHDRTAFSTTPRRWNGLHNMCRAATNEYRKLKGLNRDKFDWKARLAQQYRRIAKGYTNRQISWLSPGSRSQCQINPH